MDSVPDEAFAMIVGRFTLTELFRARGTSVRFYNAWLDRMRPLYDNATARREMVIPHYFAYSSMRGLRYILYDTVMWRGAPYACFMPSFGGGMPFRRKLRMSLSSYMASISCAPPPSNPCPHCKPNVMNFCPINQFDILGSHSLEHAFPFKLAQQYYRTYPHIAENVKCP